MDAVKFIKEAKRMCQSYEECEACPANADGFDDCLINTEQNIDEENAVNIVEKWAKEHPEKTRQDVFLEQYPEALFDGSGAMLLCPRYISAAHRNGDGMCKDPTKKCVDCSYEFWMQEVE